MTTRVSSFQNTRRWFSSTLSEGIDPLYVRNIAIIAHVDHGKTSLVNCLLESGGQVIEDRVMDSNPLEQERGITILSKNTSFRWLDERTNQEYCFNIVDTPGHSDFGAEVERIMGMVDGVALVIDATEGPMTQTKFVLGKALAQNLPAVVVLNKADRDSNRIGVVENEVFDLFLTMDANDEQMEYPVVYASAKDGWSATDVSNEDEKKEKMATLCRALIDRFDAPKVSATDPFSMLVTQIESNPFFGKCLVGLVSSGSIKVNDWVKVLDEDGKQVEKARVLKLLSRQGTEQLPIDEARAGDIISIAGLPAGTVNHTLLDPSLPNEVLPSIPIDPPTLSMEFGINSSPLAGRTGDKLTSSAIGDRLLKESENNVSIKVRPVSGSDTYEVRARGDLQLGILMETMRREGFEFSVLPPQVVMRADPDKAGGLLEPIEELEIECDEEYAGLVIAAVSSRKAEMEEMNSAEGVCKMRFTAPTRGMLGYRAAFVNETRGTGMINSIFKEYAPFKGDIPRVQRGAIISMADGTANNYALEGIETRGKLFVTHNEDVYAGMVIGEHAKENNLECNPVKAKQLTNFRTQATDAKTRLTPATVMTIEETLAYMREDEAMEVTGTHVRLRKQILDSNERKRLSKKNTRKYVLDDK